MCSGTSASVATVSPPMLHDIPEKELGSTPIRRKEARTMLETRVRDGVGSGCVTHLPFCFFSLGKSGGQVRHFLPCKPSPMQYVFGLVFERAINRPSW